MTGEQIAACAFAGVLVLMNAVVLIVGLCKDAPSTTGYLKSEHGQRWASLVIILAVVVFLLAFDLLKEPILAFISSIAGFALGRAVSAKQD